MKPPSLLGSNSLYRGVVISLGNLSRKARPEGFPPAAVDQTSTPCRPEKEFPGIAETTSTAATEASSLASAAPARLAAGGTAASGAIDAAAPARRQKITISTIFFYNNEVSIRFAETLMPQLLRHLDRHPDSLELIITNNAPDNRITGIVNRMRALAKGNPRLTIVQTEPGYNTGFGGAHNAALCASTGDIFIPLNNDMFIDAPDWIASLVSPLAQESVAISGLHDSPRKLNTDGNGSYAETGEETDYVDGSLFAIRTALARKHGLFATDLPIAYCEDSDLSLRYRELGYRLALTSIPYTHLRGSSAKMLPDSVRAYIRATNRSRFLSRWGGYLRNRKLHNRIFLDLVSDGWEDVLCTLPAVLKLAEDHQNSYLLIRTNQKLLPALLDHPRLNFQEGVTPLSREELAGKAQSHDRVFSLTMVEYARALYLGMNIAANLGVEFKPILATAHLRKRFSGQEFSGSNQLPHGKKIAVIHADYQRTAWEGRGIAEEALLPSISLLKEREYHCIHIGGTGATGKPDTLAEHCDLDLAGQLSFTETMTLLSRTELFVGIDAGPLHMAQLLNVSSFVIFGATLPSSRILNWHNSSACMNWELDCLGCYHRNTTPTWNFCIRRDQACMKKLNPRAIRDELAVFLEQGARFHPQILARLRQHEAWQLEQERQGTLLRESFTGTTQGSATSYASPLDIANAHSFKHLLQALRIQLGRKVRILLGRSP